MDRMQQMRCVSKYVLLKQVPPKVEMARYMVEEVCGVLVLPDPKQISRTDAERYGDIDDCVAASDLELYEG